MYDDDVRQQELEKTRSLAHRLAGLIHEGLRLQQEHPLAADRRLRELALEAVAKPGGAVPSGNRLGRHEPDVVAVAGVARPRVPETDNQAHQQPTVDSAQTMTKNSAW